MAEWIATGARGVSADDPKLSHIQVLPEQIDVSRGSKQQLIVLAHYSNGRVDDVTHWAKFHSSNEAVAQVNADGQVSVSGNGKGAVVGWFASRIAISSIISPYETKIANTQLAYSEFKPANFIDEILLEEWQRLHLAPSPGCSDETFLRRAFIDTVGVLPTPERVRAFLGDTRPDRRERLVEELCPAKPMSITGATSGPICC